MKMNTFSLKMLSITAKSVKYHDDKANKDIESKLYTLECKQVIPNGDDLPVRPFKISIFAEFFAGFIKSLKLVDGTPDQYTRDDMSWGTSGYVPGQTDYELGQRRCCSTVMDLDREYVRTNKDGSRKTDKNGSLIIRKQMKVYWIEFWDGDEWCAPDGFGPEETLRRVLKVYYRPYVSTLAKTVAPVTKEDKPTEDDQH